MNMKTFVLIFLAFFLIGTAPTYAEDLLGNRDLWPAKQRVEKSRFTSEERGAGLGAAIGYIAGQALGGSKYAPAGAVGGLFIGSHFGARSGARQSAQMAQQNCRVVYAYKTDPSTGQTNAQQSMYCDEMVRRDIPTAQITAPSPATYGTPKPPTPVDPRSALSERDRKILEERDEAERPQSLSEEEAEVIRQFREFRKNTVGTPEAPAQAPEDGERLKPTSIRYTPCKRYNGGVINPNC